MRLPKLLAAATAAALLCAPAFAEDKDPADTPKAAAARALADATITRLGIGDQFENGTDGEMPRVRHKASRMACMVSEEPANFSITFGPNVPRGDDVTCTASILGKESQRAVRYAKPPALKDALGQAVASLKGEVEKVKPYKGQGVSATASLAETMPMTTARFIGRQNGQAVYARVTVFIVGDWVYTHKLIAPGELAQAADLLAEIELVMETLELMETGAPATSP